MLYYMYTEEVKIEHCFCVCVSYGIARLFLHAAPSLLLLLLLLLFQFQPPSSPIGGRKDMGNVGVVEEEEEEFVIHHCRRGRETERHFFLCKQERFWALFVFILTGNKVRDQLIL